MRNEKYIKETHKHSRVDRRGRDRDLSGMKVVQDDNRRARKTSRSAFHARISAFNEENAEEILQDAQII